MPADCPGPQSSLTSHAQKVHPDRARDETLSGGLFYGFQQVQADHIYTIEVGNIACRRTLKTLFRCSNTKLGVGQNHIALTAIAHAYLFEFALNI